MAAPSFIQKSETVWNTATTPKTTASFSVQVGDILVALGVSQNNSTTITIAGGSLTWTLQQEVNVSGYAHTYAWTAVANANTSITVTFTSPAGGGSFGGNVLTFRGGSVGASAKGNAAGSAPSINITTTAANSAIVVVMGDGDFNDADGASRVWRTNAGALTEETYARDPVSYAVYIGHHADAGAAATYAVGLTTPSTQWALAAVEVLGTVTALEQEGYRWRNDDGTEATATFKAAQDTNINMVVDQVVRMRMIINASGDPVTKGYKLQYRKVGDPAWRNVDTSG